MIEVSELCFGYPGGEFQLEINSFTVSPGETVVLVGSSGCGKTTLLHLTAGILLPGRGHIRVDNCDLPKLGEAARRRFRLRQLGLVFQEFELVEHLHVLDNILLPCRLGADCPVDSRLRRRAADLAEDVGLAGKLRRPVRQLSQGERQRVGLCRALLLEPAVLLCDEPTGNLDPKTTEDVLSGLFGYAQRHQASLVMVTHDHTLLDRFDRVVEFADLSSISLGTQP